MASTTTANNGICHLFRLSAELRNRIYRDVLVEDDDIPVDTRGAPGIYSADTFAQPGILRTCHQIRSEATSIYYLENHFVFELGSVDAGKLIAFCEQARPYWQQAEILRVYVHGARDNWRNLFEWLQAYHENRAPLCKCEDGWGCGGCIPARMFEMVDAVDPEREMPWERVEAVLSVARAIVESEHQW